VSKIWKGKTGVRTNVSHGSQTLAGTHVCSDVGDGNGGMPAKSCVIGRFGYEDKYRSEPSFVIATFMRKRAGQSGAECLCFPLVLKKKGRGAVYMLIDSACMLKKSLLFWFPELTKAV
jgi:hypothetical protein